MILLGYEKLEGVWIDDWELRNPRRYAYIGFGLGLLLIEAHFKWNDTNGLISIANIVDMSGIIQLRFSMDGSPPMEILTPIGEIRTLKGVKTCIKTLLLGITT